MTAERLLAERGALSPTERYGLDGASDAARLVEGTCTALMELYRREHRDEVFEALIALARPALLRRVRARLRCLGSNLDPADVLQDVVINVYRYPDRFDGSRCGAFRAWSSTIVDNTIRRQLRTVRRSGEVQLQPSEILATAPDSGSRDPAMRAQAAEECRTALAALRYFLVIYMHAFQELSDRERFVLQMVEVRGMRYGEVARALDIRPEALKMVVFRARRRIMDRIDGYFAQLSIAR